MDELGQGKEAIERRRSTEKSCKVAPLCSTNFADVTNAKEIVAVGGWL